MGIVEDGPCQLVSRTGEGMELLFPNQVNTRSCFGPLNGLADTRAGNLSQGSKRVCKLLGEGVLGGRQAGVELLEMGILENGEWAWPRQVEQSCVESRVACARARARLLKFWRCETKLFSDTHPEVTAVHNQPRTASKSLIPTPRDDPSAPGRNRQVAKSPSKVRTLITYRQVCISCFYWTTPPRRLGQTERGSGLFYLQTSTSTCYVCYCRPLAGRTEGTSCIQKYLPVVH